MPSFHSGHLRVFCHVLFDAAAKIDETEINEREIIIIAPWISDITISTSGWSESAIKSSFSPYSRGRIESLSDVLGLLVKIGYKVTVVTLSTVGKWLPKKLDFVQAKRERQFMEKLQKLGVNCRRRNNLHMKYLYTPFSIFSGSINFTFNGLSGRNQEGSSFFVKSIHSQEYNQRKKRIDSVLVGAQNYFSSDIPITDYKIAKFPNFPKSKIPETSFEGFENYPPLSDNLYPKMIPAGYIPQGNIGNLIGEKEISSMKAQCLQVIVRVANWSTELFSHKLKRGFTKNEIYSDVIGNMETDSGAEKVPEIYVIRNLLLPNDKIQEKYIMVRLGISDDEQRWKEWRYSTTKLFDGLEYISDKISNDIGLTDKDARIIEELTKFCDEEIMLELI